MTSSRDLDEFTLRCVASAFDMSAWELGRAIDGFSTRSSDPRGGTLAQCEARTQLGRRCAREGFRRDRVATWLPVLCGQHWEKFETDALTWLIEAARESDAFKVLDALLAEAFGDDRPHLDGERRARRGRLSKRIERAVGGSRAKTVQEAIREMWA